MVYTLKEKTEKKYKLSFAIEQAKGILKMKHNKSSCCVNSVKNRSQDELLTIVEVNKIIDTLVDDSLDYC